MVPLVISTYSLSLSASCKEFGIEADFEEHSTSAIQPLFILNKLKQHKRAVLWVNPDAGFLQHSDFNEFESCDFAVRVNEFLPEGHASRIVPNAVFVQYNAAAITLMEEWCLQKTLGGALIKNKDLCFLPMPLKYSKMFDYDDLFISDREIVIEHSHASRHNKKKFHELCQNHCCH